MKRLNKTYINEPILFGFDDLDVAEEGIKFMESNVKTEDMDWVKYSAALKEPDHQEETILEIMEILDSVAPKRTKFGEIRENVYGYISA